MSNRLSDQIRAGLANISSARLTTESRAGTWTTAWIGAPNRTSDGPTRRRAAMKREAPNGRPWGLLPAAWGRSEGATRLRGLIHE